MRVNPCGILLLALCISLTSPSRAEIIYEPTYTLDFRDTELADVADVLERIFERRVDRAGLDKGTLTLLAGGQVAKSDVIAVTSFALSLRGLTVAETPGGELKLARIPDFHGNCDRPRASIPEVVAGLTRGRENTRASIQLASVPAAVAIRGLAHGISAVIAIDAATDAPVGAITLSSGPRRMAEAYGLLFSALERDGNAVLAGPSGSLAIVGCPREPPSKALTPIGLPYLFGTFLSEDSSIALIATGSSEDPFVSTQKAGDVILDLGRGESFVKIWILGVRSDSMLLRRQRGCAVLEVGHGGAGRRVPCPRPPASRDRED